MLSRHKKFHPLLSAFSFIFVDIVEIKAQGDVFNETEIFQIGFHRHKNEREEKAFSHDGNGKGLWPRIMLTSDFIG